MTPYYGHKTRQEEYLNESKTICDGRGVYGHCHLSGRRRIQRHLERAYHNENSTSRDPVE